MKEKTKLRLFLALFLASCLGWCASEAPPTLPMPSGAELRPPLGQEWPEEKWLEARKSGVGGSDISAIIENSPYATAFSKWAEKLGLYKQETTPAMGRGTALEPVARKMYEMEKEKKVSAFPPRSFFQSKQNPIFRAQIDGLLLEDRVIVEIKTTIKDREEGEILRVYNDQIQWQMGVLGPEWKVADVAVLFCAREVDAKSNVKILQNPQVAAQEFCADSMKIYRVNRNEQYIEKLRMAATKFWQKVETKTSIEPPDFYLGSVGKGGALDNTRNALTAVYRQGRKFKDGIIPANEKAKNIIAHLEEAKDDKEKETLKNKLRFLVGESGAKGIQSGDIVYTWHSSGQLTRSVKTKK